MPTPNAARPTALRLLALTPILTLAAAGCGGRGPSAEPAAARPPSPPATTPRPAGSPEAYDLAGVVRRVDPGSGLVTIRHEAIPGLMGAMTMPFAVKDREALAEVRAGDEVSARLRVVREGGEVKDYDLTDLTVTRPATPTIDPGPAAAKAAPAVLRPGDLVPDFAMTTQDGRPLRLSDLRGKAVALTFIYTRCPLPEFCPRMDRKFATLAERLGAVRGRAEDVRLLSVSFDPGHDTPAVLKAHADARGARPPLWTFAVASHEELARVAGPLGLIYGPGRDEVVHNLSVAVIDPDGRLARLETGAAAGDWQATDLFKTLRSRIQGKNN